MRRSSAYNVIKLWNMNDLSEPFSKFRNTCPSSRSLLSSRTSLS